MRSNRRRNWFLKRIALGLAVAAIAAPVAQAKVDEGSTSGSNGYQPFVTDFPSYPAINAADNSMNKIEVVRVEQPRSTGSDVVAADYGMPRAMPNDYALSSGDQIEVVRAFPRGTSSDKIEFVRTQPREIGQPQVVSAGFNWDDAAIGAGLVLGLLLIGWGAVQATKHLGRPQTA
jgi:hypothetical protein